jgi:hypothetical protein
LSRDRPIDTDSLREKTPLHLELPDNGQSVIGDRGADAGNDGIVDGQGLAAMPQNGLVRRNVHMNMQRIDDIDVVSAGSRRFDDASMRVEAGVAREHHELHVDTSGRRHMADGRTARRSSKTG